MLQTSQNFYQFIFAKKVRLGGKRKQVKAGGDGVEWDSQTKYIKINELKSFGTNY